jgi:hypothetical protein
VIPRAAILVVRPGEGATSVMTLTVFASRSPLSSLLPLASSDHRRRALMHPDRRPPGTRRAGARPRWPRRLGAVAAVGSGRPPCPPASPRHRRRGVAVCHRWHRSRSPVHGGPGCGTDAAPRMWRGPGCARSLRRPALGGQAVPTPQAAGPDDGTAGPRRHAVPEPVILRPFPDVGLVGSLHVPSFLPRPAGEAGQPGPRAATHDIGPE